MNLIYHDEITRAALGSRFSPAALEAILATNLGQDSLQGQIGHPEFHCDNSAFAQADAYAQLQRKTIIVSLAGARIPLPAWQAFGRLTHTLQDFYAHSNYVPFWVELHPGLPPDRIDPLDQGLIHSPNLRSGRFYSPLEFLYFLPFIGHKLKPLFPRDSHAWMNLDSPGTGPLFAYALAAARLRTAHELQSILDQLNPEAQKLFLDGRTP